MVVAPNRCIIGVNNSGTKYAPSKISERVSEDRETGADYWEVKLDGGPGFSISGLPWVLNKFS